ncbi:MAG TPA: tyrosine-type recombinase/integrase [Allosphingosinicella sp.]|nr:tyrosine-type recombinase/integrase [Allosphingosinicella sp.]
MSDVAGVHFVRSARPGKPVRWYVYAWRGGPLIMKTAGPTRPRLDREALSALAAEQAKLISPRDEGTLAGLARRWRGTIPAKASPEWTKLAATTKETWGYELDAIERRWGETPLDVWNDPRMVAKVIAWRDSRAATPRAADMGVQVLGELLFWGKLRTMVAINVAADVPALYEGADRAEIIWLEQDDEAFALSALALNRPHVIDGLDLANVTGMRRGDLIGVTFDEVSDHAIVRTARKKSRGRRRRAVIPLIPESRRLIAELRTRHREPGVNTLLVNSLGRPWTAGSFTAAFNQIRDAANGAAGIIHPGDPSLGEPDRVKHLHDCRGTFVTKLCRTNLTDEEIGRIVAWSPQNVGRVRRTYVDDAATVVALSERIRPAL